MAGRSATLVIQVISETAKATQGLSVFGRTIDTNVVAKGLAAAAAIAGATAAIVSMTKAAGEDEAEQTRLMTAVQAAGAAHGDYATQIDKAIVAGEALAFTDTQIRNALTPLIGVTGDVGKANELLATAQDVARLSGVDLEVAAKAVAKAHDGSAGALAKLTQTNAKGKDATQIMAEAQRKAAGQAQTYGKTIKGQSESMAIGFDEVQEMIGKEFLPAFMEILPALKQLIPPLSELIKELLPIMIPFLKGVAKGVANVAYAFGDWMNDVRAIIAWVENLIRTVQRFLATIGEAAGAVGRFAGGIFGGQMAPAPALATGRAAYVAMPGSIMPRSLPSARASAPAGNVTINISGAIDPEGTARQVSRLLAQHGMRTGVASTLVTGQAL